MTLPTQPATQTTDPGIELLAADLTRRAQTLGRTDLVVTLERITPTDTEAVVHVALAGEPEHGFIVTRWGTHGYANTYAPDGTTPIVSMHSPDYDHATGYAYGLMTAMRSTHPF